MVKQKLLRAAGYDYELLDNKDLKGKLKYFLAEIDKKQKSLAASMIGIASALSSALESFTEYKKTGQFKVWVEAEFAFSIRTAYKMVAAHRVFGDYDPTVLSRYNDSAMYVLSEPGVPDSVRESLRKSAEQGAVITHAIAKDAIPTNKPSPDPPKEEPNPEEEVQLPEDLSPTVANQITSGEIDVTSEEIEALIEYEKPAQCDIIKSMDEEGHDTVTEAIEADVEKQKPPQQRMEEDAAVLSSWASAVTSMINMAPDSPLLDESRLNIIKSQLKQAAATIRMAKGKALCNLCNGDGCKKCHEAGWHNKLDAGIQESLAK